jgi:hypothetical protein
MKDKDLVLSIYPNATDYCRKDSIKHCIVDDIGHSYMFISGFYYFEDHAWEEVAKRIKMDMLRKLES